MFKRLLFLLCFVYSCSHISTGTAQTTVVSATVTDTDGQLWTYGSVQVEFVPNPSVPNVSTYRINGAPLSNAVLYQGPVSLGASGAFSLTVYDNTQITPIGSQFKYTICPNASYQCGSFTVGAAGATQNLTSAVNAAIKAPRFKAISGTYGYSDIEASLLLQPGSTYWSTTNGQQRFWNSTTQAWVTGSGASGGSVTSFQAPSASWPSWLVPAVSNPTTSPALTVSASQIPSSAIAGNGCITLGSTGACLNTSVPAVAGLTIDGVSPTTMGYVDPSSSIQTQLNTRVRTDITSPQSVLGVLSAPYFLASTAYTANPANPVVLMPGTSASVDAQVLNAAGTGTTLQVDDMGNWYNVTTQVVIPSTATQWQGDFNGGPLLTSVAPSGTGAVCRTSSCALNNATANLQSTSDNSLLLATDQWVKAYVSSIASGVSSIVDSSNNSYTGNIKFPSITCTAGSPVTCVINATAIPSVVLNIPATTYPANQCYGSALGVAATLAMPGILPAVAPATASASIVWPTWQGGSQYTNGWGGVGGLNLHVWPDPAGNLVDWYVCNTTTASITSNFTTVVLGAQ